MKTVRNAFLGILCLSVALILATGCYRPAAPDVTVPPVDEDEVDSPLGTPDLQATAIANATEAAQTREAEVPVEEEPTPLPPEPPATEVPPPATETPEPPPVDPEDEPSPPPPPAETTTYVVQQNDTLFSIAMRYGTTVAAISEANGIVNPAAIYPGQRLVIPSTADQPPSPGETTYIVRPGDNLFRIALRYNMSYERLAAYNGITDPSAISVGQVIRIPPR